MLRALAAARVARTQRCRFAIATFYGNYLQSAPAMCRAGLPPDLELAQVSTMAHHSGPCYPITEAGALRGSQYENDSQDIERR